MIATVTTTTNPIALAVLPLPPPPGYSNRHVHEHEWDRNENMRLVRCSRCGFVITDEDVRNHAMPRRVSGNELEREPDQDPDPARPKQRAIDL